MHVECVCLAACACSLSKERYVSHTITAPPPQIQSQKSPRKLLFWLVGIIAAIAIVFAAVNEYVERIVKRDMVKILAAHYHSEVELQDFDVAVLPSVRISGKGLVMRRSKDRNLPPFIAIQEFTVTAPLWNMLRNPKRLSTVELKELNITIPRGENEDKNAQPQQNSKHKLPDFVIDSVNADHTTLTFIPKEPGKRVLTFDIRDLKLKSAGDYTKMHYVATVRNPLPPGMVQSQGNFGPWNQDDPSKTALSGKYTFRNADMGAFHGLGGTLSSDGEFKGILERLDIKGTTDIPDFTVRKGTPVHLKTTFHSIVDGTDGTTLLQPVRAQWNNTTVIANGGVLTHEGLHGKEVRLDVETDGARVEDMLRLVSSGEPLLNGAISFKGTFDLPPGEPDVIDRVKITGSFGVENAHFPKPKVEKKISKLSEKAQGKQDDSGIGNVASDFRGSFEMKNAAINFSDLGFAIPGALVQLAGVYNIDKDSLDFHGMLNMQAKVSEMTTGVKSFFLKLVDPLFKGKHGGSTIPIKISGSHDHPQVGLDVKRVVGK